VAQSGARQYREAIATFSAAASREQRATVSRRWASLSLHAAVRSRADDLMRGAGSTSTIYGSGITSAIVAIVGAVDSRARERLYPRSPIAPDSSERFRRHGLVVDVRSRAPVAR